MNSYVSLVKELILNEIGKGNKINIIKLENFIHPKVYYEVCLYFRGLLKNKNIDFKARLSKEKYEFWKGNPNFSFVLKEMDKEGLIEKEEHLTKWRNHCFNNNIENCVVFLMGTELVEDQGGIEDFYKINPHIIENYVGNKYSVMFQKNKYIESLNLSSQYLNILDNIYKNIFIHIPKDLFNLSEFIDSLEYIEDKDELVKYIFENLNEWWDLPNVRNILSNPGLDNLENKKIDLLDKAYKFVNRSIISKYQTDKKILSLRNTADKYYKKHENEIISEFNEKFPGYNDYFEVVEDIINYIQGIKIGEVKQKLFKCNFTDILGILNYKESTVKATHNKVPKIYGDPFRAIYLPILIELNNLPVDLRNDINKIRVNIQQISLANTISESDNEDSDLKIKWKNMCRFLGGIETLFEDLMLSNCNGEIIELEVYSEISSNEDTYPFDIKNAGDLLKKGILKSASASEQRSKITMEYEFYTEGDEEAIEISEYEWHIFETDFWANTYNFIESSFEDFIKQDKFVPIGICKELNSVLDITNEEEVIYSIKDLEVKYKDVIEELKGENDELIVRLHDIGETFNNVINNIKENGLFNSIKNTGMIQFIGKYNELLDSLICNLRNGEHLELARIFSKSFLLINEDNIYSDHTTGALMMPYHPVMIEKIIERYNYLANGFAEIFEELKLSKTDKYKINIITNKFDRLDQLATITFGSSILIGEDNKFVPCNSTYGFYSLYGSSRSDVSSSKSVDFGINDEDFTGTVQSNPVSTYISRVIGDYLNTYPSKIDGINISFIEPKHYKNLISGLHNIIIKLEKEKLNVKINVHIYTNDYKCNSKNYIKYWLENKFTEEDNITVKAHIKYIDFSSSIDNIKNSISKSDLIFVENVLDMEDIKTELVNDPVKKDISQSRYPSVYLPIPCNEAKSRKVSITQTQFEVEYNHTKYMTYMQNKNVKDGQYKAVKKVVLKSNIEQLIEGLHDIGTWIVIIDENIDVDILNLKNNKIIGFSTGNGYFGELNTTISTKQEYLNDLRQFLTTRLRHKFSNWKAKHIEDAAQECINYAKYLDGSEILKAINPNDESINNYLAYLLTSKFENIFENSSDKFYIRKIISLDSHSHLFDNQLELSKEKNINSRPDFLILEVEKENNNLLDNENIKIKAKILECKLAKANDIHIQKAKDQVYEGYRRLSNIWNADSHSVERRFWFNQLYRLLAYNSTINRIENKTERDLLINKLTGINEGNFEIEFYNYEYTYWVDTDFGTHYEEEIDNVDDVDINIFKFSKNYIKELLIGVDQNDEELSGKEEQFVQSSNKIDDINVQIGTSREEYDTHDNSEEYYDVAVAENEEVLNQDPLIIDTEILELFKTGSKEAIKQEEESIKSKLNTLKNQLEIRKIRIIPHDYIIGPDIARIRVQLAAGVNFSQVERYAEEMKLWLGINEQPLLFIADGHVNIDIVREKRQTIRMKDILSKINKASDKYQDIKDKFYILLGEDVLGNPKLVDMSDSNSPHLLIAGQTGSGKSVLVNVILSSIMSMYTPEEVELILVDPKFVELTLFEDSEYTRNRQAATEPEEAVNLLDELVSEMDSRYRLFKSSRAKNITEYNKKNPDNKLKRILMVFDEYGAMIESSSEVRAKLENAIKQLSQKARAAGIHIIICTQTPKAEIITTTIRNNLTARIALKVIDSNASNLILDTKGAESLLGKGDMLLKTADTSNLIRIKSPYIEEDEVESVVKYLNNKFKVEDNE
ncbi:DNA translocase FtsK [Alkalithermobacter paradoxus]|uniref:DNA translocase FtsK n=1 Tax=Alkalithermobacter paradoxus TaxID=29349 RepID=A0A1V4I6Z7_9FIRM|nr:DNA translocase FtsK [[Clostridium] thermoalcaliphilum]